MYSVSLLPSEYKAIHQNARKKDILLLIAIGVIGVLTVIYLTLYIAVLNMEKEYLVLQDENVDILIQIDKLDDIEPLYSQVNSLLARAVAAKGMNPKWDELIACIGNSVPESVGLSSISLQYNGTNQQCVIEGTANNHQAVAQWLEVLETVEGIDQIKCSFSTVQQQEIDTVSKFKLSFSLLPGPGYSLPLEVR